VVFGHIKQRNALEGILSAAKTNGKDYQAGVKT